MEGGGITGSGGVDKLSECLSLSGNVKNPHDGSILREGLSDFALSDAGEDVANVEDLAWLGHRAGVGGERWNGGEDWDCAGRIGRDVEPSFVMTTMFVMTTAVEVVIIAGMTLQFANRQLPTDNLPTDNDENRHHTFRRRGCVGDRVVREDGGGSRRDGVLIARDHAWAENCGGPGAHDACSIKADWNSSTPATASEWKFCFKQPRVQGQGGEHGGFVHGRRE